MQTQLLQLLTLEQISENEFSCNQHLGNRYNVLFGGQVLAQALLAASSTVSDRNTHSLHGYFLRAGSRDVPVYFSVDRVRDGGSFSTRHVVAHQQGKTIFQLLASFHSPESGMSHQESLPPSVANGDIRGVMQPEQLASIEEQAKSIPQVLPYLLSAGATIEIRPVTINGYLNDAVSTEKGQFWFRARENLGASQALQRAALAFASDRCLMASCAMQHPISMFDENIRSASLDHAMWFHDDVDTTQWHLYITDSPWAGAGRALSRGAIYTRDGRLLATTMQEGLVRGVENALSQSGRRE